MVNYAAQAITHNRYTIKLYNHLLLGIFLHNKNSNSPQTIFNY